MLYKSKIKEVMLDVLHERISGITDCVIALLEEGYLPNKNKYKVLNWGSILIDAYENVDILSEEQHIKLDNLYNKVIKL